MKKLTRKTIIIILIIITVIGLGSALQSFYIYKTGEGYCPGTYEETSFPGSTLPGEQDGIGGLPTIETGGETSECAYLYGRPESSIAGIHFSELAPIYFITILIILLLYYFIYHGILKILLGILYLVGLLAIPYLVYIEVKLSVICFYCTIMHIIIISSSILYYYEYRLHRP